MIVRASIGTLATIGLLNIDIVEKPTTAYILLYSRSGCLGTCMFCSQSMLSTSSKSLVSRVSWPEVDLEVLTKGIKGCDVFERVCIQTVIKEGFKEDVLEIINTLRSEGIGKPVSVSLTPTDKDYLTLLKDLGVDYLGIGFDAATPKTFNLVKKPYSWQAYLEFLRDCIDVFGPNKIYIHLIYGLGDNDLEFINAMKYFTGLGVRIALFAFTPIKGTPYESHDKPNIVNYRKVQILRYLLTLGYDVDDYIIVNNGNVYLRRELVKNILENIDEYLNAFITSGCPGCNRPFYNESVRGPYYNYPSTNFLRKHISDLMRELRILMDEGGSIR